MIKIFRLSKLNFVKQNQISIGDRTSIKCLVDIFREGLALRGGHEIAACGLGQNNNYNND
jgi:hypothetical protein